MARLIIALLLPLLAVSAAVVLAATLTARCDSGQHPSQPTPAVTVTVQTSEPSPVSLGTPVLDRVAAALSAGEAAGIDGLLDWFPMPCDSGEATGLKCPAGTPGGAVLQVVAGLLVCSGSGGAYILQQPSLQFRLKFLEDRLALEGGYRTVAVAGSSDELDLAKWAAGVTRYMILESRSQPSRGLIVGVSDSGIRLLATQCGSSAVEMLASVPWPSLRYVNRP
jgi:hypothetical protein